MAATPDMPRPLTDEPHPAARWQPGRHWLRPRRPAAPSDAPRLRIMSYNILAEDLRLANMYLYNAVPERVGAWTYRLPLILAEILHYAPSILCLQEVQSFPQLADTLCSWGYQGCFVPRTGGKPDGCAMFWCDTR
jgi:mRNA deadenylase 3'-5' endonuclease subunit Ccr4